MAKVPKDVIMALVPKVQAVINRLWEIHNLSDTVGISALSDTTMHVIWFKTWASIAFPDDNPNVLRNIDGSRVLAHDPNFPIYPCNTNDASLRTMLRAIRRQLTDPVRQGQKETL